MRTRSPARASSMAAARPFGPAPTMTASNRGAVTCGDQAELPADSSGGASPSPTQPPNRRRQRRDGHVHGRAVAQVADVAPLATSVDADLLGPDIRRDHADRARQILERLLPEPIVHPVRAKDVAQLDE